MAAGRPVPVPMPHNYRRHIKEPVVIYAYVRPAPFVARLPELVAFVRRMGRETNQGAIALEFDGNFFTVEELAPNH
jgi:hypothetical protein